MPSFLTDFLSGLERGTRGLPQALQTSERLGLQRREGAAKLAFEQAILSNDPDAIRAAFETMEKLGLLPSQRGAQKPGVQPELDPPPGAWGGAELPARGGSVVSRIVPSRETQAPVQATADPAQAFLDRAMAGMRAVPITTGETTVDKPSPVEAAWDREPETGGARFPVMPDFEITSSPPELETLQLLQEDVDQAKDSELPPVRLLEATRHIRHGDSPLLTAMVNRAIRNRDEEDLVRLEKQRKAKWDFEERAYKRLVYEKNLKTKYEYKEGWMINPYDPSDRYKLTEHMEMEKAALISDIYQGAWEEVAKGGITPEQGLTNIRTQAAISNITIPKAMLHQFETNLAQYALKVKFTGSMQKDIGEAISIQMNAESIIENLQKKNVQLSLGKLGGAKWYTNWLMGGEDIDKSVSDVMFSLGMTRDQVVRLRTGAAVNDAEDRLFKELIGSTFKDPMAMADRMEMLIRHMDSTVLGHWQSNLYAKYGDVQKVEEVMLDVPKYKVSVTKNTDLISLMATIQTEQDESKSDRYPEGNISQDQADRHERARVILMQRGLTEEDIQILMNKFMQGS